jgi:dephospho-CoA kinase
MKVIGMLGGVASGKSLVAQELARLGAGLLDADRAAHEVLRMPEVETAARERWGTKVFGPDGRIDRARLAEIVFADAPGGPRERKYLEQLTHPKIGPLLAREAERLAASGTAVAVLDAPLLLEAGWDKLCERLVFVDAPRGLPADARSSRAFLALPGRLIAAAVAGPVMAASDGKPPRASPRSRSAGGQSELNPKS